MDTQHLTAISTSLSNSAIPIFLNNILKTQLPYALPLYRRCQFHLHRLSEVKTGEVWVATIASLDDIPSIKNSEHDIFKLINDKLSVPWIAAHIDLTNPGQTQVWLYASWESNFSTVADPVLSVLSSASYPVYRQLLGHLFNYLRTKHILNLPATPSDQWTRLKENGKIVSAPYSRSKVLFGTVAEALWPFLDDGNLVRGSTSTTDTGEISDLNLSATARQDRPYLKYILQLPSKSLSSESLRVPSGFCERPMSSSHLQTIIDRTSIPRTIETIRQLPSMALYDESTNTPVAWGLLGKDGSLSSLHTEDAYRGRGFAETICRALWRVQDKVFSSDSGGEIEAYQYGHADVSESNIASRRVLEKLGAKVEWKVGWIEVDLGEAK